jgi:hypothetical protein
MDYYFTYEKSDTLKSRTLLDLNPQTSSPATLNVGRNTIQANKLNLDLATKREVKNIPLTSSQLRYMASRAESKLLVDNSRFIKPMDVEVYEMHTTPASIILPERRIEQQGYDWITIILTLSLFLFATVRIPYAKYIEHMFQSLVNYPTATRMFREKNYSILHGAFRLDIYFYAIFSLFIYQALKFYGVDLPISNFVLYLFCILAVLGYFSLKRMFYSVTAMVSEGQAEASEYWFNLNNYNRVLGLFLFPVVVIIAFSPYFNHHFFLIFGLFITAIFYGMSLQRGILILLKKQFSIFYLFLYLCTLEILPLLLIFKMVLA